MRRLLITVAAAVVVAGLNGCASSNASSSPHTCDAACGSQMAEAMGSSGPGAAAAAQQQANASNVAMRVCATLGKSNRKALVRCAAQMTGKPGETITVTYAGDENLTNGLTKDQMRLDGVKVLKAVRNDVPWQYSAVTLKGTYAMTNQLGQSSEDVVYETTISRSTLGQINFENFDFKNLDKIGTDTQIAPAFEY